MTQAPIDPFAPTASKPSVSFAIKDEYGDYQDKPVGTSYTLKVDGQPTLKQVKNFTTGQLDTWPNGDPKMGVFIDVVDTTTGEELALIARKPSGVFTAIQNAQAALNGHVLRPGDILTVTFTGKKANPNGGKPFKEYSAVIQPGNAFEAPAEAPAAQTPPDFVPQTAPAAVPGTSGPVYPAGFTAEMVAAVKAQGLDPKTIFPGYSE